MISNLKLKYAALHVVAVVSLIFQCSAAAAKIFYVDHSFQGENPSGESWLSAFPTMQQAVDAAADAGGGEVWVKAGVYKPEGISRNATIQLKPNVDLYGGFRGGETRLEERNAKANRTIISGDIGRVSVTSDNCYHVLVAAEGSRIDGFIIQRGNANAAAEHRLGGGVLLTPETRNVVIANCTFEKNNAEFGGAIHLQGAEAQITNCTFYSNSADSGGAIATSGRAKLNLLNSILTSNFAPKSGGAISLTSGADVAITGSSFLYNSTDGQGGGISSKTSDQRIGLTVSDCNFTENSARNNGGAMALTGAFLPIIANCTFDRNFSTEGAGALANAGGVVALLTDSDFTGNRGKKGIEKIGNDDASSVADSAQEVDALAKSSKHFPELKPAPEPASEKKPESKPKRMLGDEFVHNAQGTKVKLSSIVAEGKHTVLALGDLTDPDFINSYRHIEAAARDYYPKGVRFYYVYRYLLHPENNGYIQPYTLIERGQHIVVAKDLLSTRVPWLCDVMENQTAKALAPEQVNSLFIYDTQGTELYAGPFSSIEAFHEALADAVGPTELTVDFDAIPKPSIEPVKEVENRFVNRIKVDSKKDDFLPLQLTPLDSRSPYYVKVRVEGDAEIRQSGDGKIYLGFHIDPLYRNEWNNLGEPLRYTIKVPDGVIAPSINSAPRVTQQATDKEPREFLLNARKLDLNKPITLQVSYSVHSPESKRNIEVTQQYLIYLAEDKFGGKVFSRQMIASKHMPTTMETAKAGNAFLAILRRFDIDRNGKLTADEVIGNLRDRFDAIDLNQNGSIEESEYLAYRENR